MIIYVQKRHSCLEGDKFYFDTFYRASFLKLRGSLETFSEWNGKAAHIPNYFYFSM